MPIIYKPPNTFKYTILAMQMASKNMQETLSEVYEPEWPGHEQLYVQGQNSEMLWADLSHKLSDQVLIPLNTYQGQFPEMRVSNCISYIVKWLSCAVLSFADHILFLPFFYLLNLSK